MISAIAIISIFISLFSQLQPVLILAKQLESKIAAGKADAERRTMCIEISEKILGELNGNIGNDLNSIHDISILAFQKIPDDYEILISENSSKINLNFAETAFLDFLCEKNFLEEEARDEVIKKRTEKLLVNFSELPEIERKEMFCLSGEPSINLSDNSILEYVVNRLTKDGSYSKSLSNIIKERKFRGQYICSDAEFNMTCGIYYDVLKPYVGFSAPYNVNFVDCEILESISEYVTGSKATAYLLLEKRNERNLSKLDLQNLLGVYRNDLLPWLGTTSNGYKLKIFESGVPLAEFYFSRNHNEKNNSDKKFIMEGVKWLRHGKKY